MDIKSAHNRAPSTLSETDDGNQDRTRLIIGIDFGTTLSKAAFALISNDEIQEGIVTEWPGAAVHTKPDIPSTLYYDYHQNVVGWGLDTTDALGPLGYPKAGVGKVDWFKLHLTAPETAHPLPPEKSEIDVIADYLLNMRQAVHAQLQKALSDDFDREKDNIHYYLVVPSIWNDAAKAAIRVAATHAGLLHTENNKNQLTFITDPRATAVFYVKTEFSNLNAGDTILIVDCGGGFVDLTAFEVKKNPLTLTECAPSSGDSCGSTELHRNFAKILRAKIKKIGSRPGRLFAKCTRDFENRIMSEFRNNGQKWHIDVGFEADFPEADIQDGYMSFTNEEIQQCFAPVVDRISELIRNQISAIQAQGGQLQKILVVGGFGTSEYLFNEIRQQIPVQLQTQVTRLMNSPSATAKGAVMAGIERYHSE